MRQIRCICAAISASATGLLVFEAGAADRTAPILKVGHVGHDHHIALFVAADKAVRYSSRESGIYLKLVEDRKFYELTKDGRTVADIQIVQVGGGSKMPTALAQNVIDVGLGGTAAVLAAVDSGAPIRLIAPLHSKGDMFVVRPDFPAKSWADFITTAGTAQRPIRIGYKNPVAVAKVIFEGALRHEGIPFSGDMSSSDVKVHMVNVKGGSKLNASLIGGLIDGYVGNNPFPAIGAEKGLLRIVADLEDLPPGTFGNHPCCCLAANTEALTKAREAIILLLVLLLQANETINADLDSAVVSATRWIGTTATVERASIATSGYSMAVTPEWHGHMAIWVETMNSLGVLKQKLKGLTESEVGELAYDLAPLGAASRRLAKAREARK